MKSRFLFLILLLCIIFSCKKENLSNDCRLVEQFSIFGNFGTNVVYYYSQNRLTGRAFFGESVSLLPISATVMLYDSIVYNSPENVTVYSFECYFSPFSKDTLPNHGTDFYAKIENVLQNDKIINSKLYKKSGRTNLVLSSEKEYVYDNDNITKIIEKGIIEIPESRVRGNRTSMFVYENQKVKSVISEVFEEDGFKFGGDTLIVNSYLGFKNPLRNFHMFYYVSSLVYSESFMFQYTFNYSYKSRLGNFWSSGTSKDFTPRYTDNGKNYPKEFGTYFCD